jgi:hypothetical protein
LLFLQACGHGKSTVAAVECVPGRHGCFDGASEDGVRIKGNSYNARVNALIAKGEFAEARMLIAESLKIGTLSQQAATRLLERIDKLSMKLGEVPASLQRVANFPSQLRDYTLFQIRSMLDAKDFSLATEAQLHMAKKLIEQEPRLMAK